MRGMQLLRLARRNVFLVVFNNMAPALPMDGGRALRALLAIVMPTPHNRAKATAVAATAGKVIGAFVFLGVGPKCKLSPRGGFLVYQLSS